MRRAKRSEFFLSLLLIALVSSFDAPRGFAQTNRTLNLAGTWTTDAVVVPTANIDASITTLTRSYEFRLGKVTSAVAKSKSSGLKTEYGSDLVLDLVPNTYGEYEYRYVYKPTAKLVQTMPEFMAWTEKGTYQLAGTSISLDFSEYTVRGTVSGNSMKGVLTHKGTNQREQWAATRGSRPSVAASQNSASPSTTSSPAGRLTAADLVAYPNTVRTPEGKLRPADGYQWVNSQDPQDFRVELKPEFMSKNRSLGLIGNWEGTYLCGQGLTNLNLIISQINSSEISAVFKFSANKNNPSVPSGSFRMTGTYDNKTNKLILKATKWIDQPLGYSTVDLVGSMSQGNTRISGEIANSSCSTFALEKK